jgi:tetratricopeptide (TPR) repeat protein
VGLTIRICKPAVIAALLLSVATPVIASTSPLGSYARARLADSAGEGGAAVEAYSEALTAAPGDDAIAVRAYREAIASGDRTLALRAARLREERQRSTPDAQLLIYSDAIQRADWAKARAAVKWIEADGGLGFLAPVLTAWTDFGARSGDPLAAMARLERPDGLASVYVREHRVLLLLAMGRKAEALTELRSQTGSRVLPLKLAAAAQLVQARDREAALAALQGDDAPLVQARTLVSGGKPLPGAVNTASRGAAWLFASVARDLMRDSPSGAALTLARLAEFAAPPSDAVRMTLAQSLSLSGDAERALAQLDLIDGAGLYGDSARDTRISVLQRADRNDAAVAVARKAAESGTARDHARLGDALARVEQYRDAADAYAKAIDRLEADKVQVSWNLWFLYGGVLEAAKDWAAARPALEKALAIGGDQPEILNHLGYAMLERGEQLDRATALIAKAQQLRPDDAAIADSLGWAWFKRGEVAKAIPILEAASARDPTISEIAEHLGDAYWAAGRRIDARYSWQAALVQADKDDVQARLRAKIADGLPARKP